MADDDNMFAEFAGEPGAVAPAPDKPASDNMFAEYASPQVGLWDSFVAGNVEGASFGTMGDRAHRDASRKANPWTHFMGELTGSSVPMVAATLLPTGAGQVAAAGRASNLLSKGAGLVRSALVPGEVSTLGQAAVQGTKIGGVYAGLSGAGHTDVKDDDTTTDVLARAGGNALKHGALGMALGAPLGVAGYGASKAVGAMLNRTMPELKDVAKAASSEDLQGISDVVRHAGYDGYGVEDFVRLRNALNDPTQAHRYADLNLIEALQTMPLKALTTGELKPGVAVSPNLRDMAQDFAATQGKGRQEAVEAFATRKNEMGAKIQGDLDELVHGPQGAALQRQFGTPGRTPDADMLPAVIDRHFKSGTAELDEAALMAQKAALGKRYDRIRAKPLQNIDSLGKMAQTIPEFDAALKYAAKNDMIRMAEEGNAGATWLNTWASGKIGENFGTLSPTNILDIHHALVMNAKPALTGPTPESMMAGKLKTWFSSWVDNQFKGHKELREDYALFKRAMEAKEMAQEFSLTRGSADQPALKFLAQAIKDVDAGAKALNGRLAAYDQAMAKYHAGQRKTPPSMGDLKDGLARQEARQNVVDTYRKDLGEALKLEIARSGDAKKLVKEALTPEGQRRLMMALGEKEGTAFIGELMKIEARNMGMTLGLNAGGQDHLALQFFDRAVRQGRTDVADAFRAAWADRIKQEIASAPDPNAVIRKLLTQEGKDRILRIYGKEAGTEFIEKLYNKEMQTGLSQTLFGGPDTAHKLARHRKNDALMDAVHGITHLRPIQTLQALGELGSSAYKQRRADQGNILLSRQGPEELTKIVDGILGKYQLATTGQPYTVKPALKALGPIAETIPGQINSYLAEKPPMKPYRP